MKIGLIVPGFSADEHDWCIPALRNLVQKLAETDEVFVLSLRYPHRVDRYRCFGAQVQPLGGATRRGTHSVSIWGRALATLVAEHRQGRFDVLHTFWANEGSVVATLAGRALGVPTIVSLAGGELVGLEGIGYGGQLSRGERAKVRLSLALADAVTAGSASLLERAQPWLRSRPASRVRRIPLGVDTEMFHPSPLRVQSNQPPRLIHAASLLPIKDQGTLLQAAARLHAQGIRFTLEILGEGPEEASLKAQAERLGLAKIVGFRGALPHDQLPQAYRAGSLFVLSSRFESQCMAVLEAAACGLPTVGTGVGIIPELAPDAATAVPVGDSDSLADRIADLIADPARRARMGAAARARTEAEYSLSLCITRFRDLYGELVQVGVNNSKDVVN